LFIVLLSFSNKNHGSAKPQDVHIIGHSLGAHIAGYAGERTQNLGRITGSITNRICTAVFVLINLNYMLFGCLILLIEYLKSSACSCYTVCLLCF